MCVCFFLLNKLLHSEKGPVKHIFSVEYDYCLTHQCKNILTSTKLIITDFLAMIYKNEQLRTASLCRGWAMSENDFNLKCR